MVIDRLVLEEISVWFTEYGVTLSNFMILAAITKSTEAGSELLRTMMSWDKSML